MTDLVLSPITTGYNLNLINVNFQNIQDKINDYCLLNSGGNNILNQDLDMNGFSILNIGTDTSEPSSMLTIGVGDARYYNITGDALTGPMNVNGQTITNIAEPLVDSSPVRKQDLDEESAIRQSTDAALQDQINGTTPLLASAFSPISWHVQHIPVSVAIPDNMNAWSFGPTMSIDLDQTVTVGAGSFWTIAEGRLV